MLLPPLWHFGTPYYVRLSRNLHVHYVRLSRNLYILCMFKQKLVHKLSTFKQKFVHTLCTFKHFQKFKLNWIWNKSLHCLNDTPLYVEAVMVVVGQALNVEWGPRNEEKGHHSSLSIRCKTRNSKYIIHYYNTKMDHSWLYYLNLTWPDLIIKFKWPNILIICFLLSWAPPPKKWSSLKSLTETMCKRKLS